MSAKGSVCIDSKRERAQPGFEPGACHISDSENPGVASRSDNHTTLDKVSESTDLGEIKTSRT